jgi:prepilin-type N-terminal cleavage/methylation domain-containing protein
MAMTKNKQSGFTLIEMVVTLAIIGILTRLLTPVVANYIDQARITRASQETQLIADAILNFNKNTGKWPVFLAGSNITVNSATYNVLTGPGNQPACASCTLTWLNTNNVGDLGNILERNTAGFPTTGKFAWRGPYITSVGADPWGNQYYVNGTGMAFGQNKAVFVLSAGPNQTIETTFSQNIGSGSSAVVIGGDDIVARVR